MFLFFLLLFVLVNEASADDGSEAWTFEHAMQVVKGLSKSSSDYGANYQNLKIWAHQHDARVVLSEDQEDLFILHGLVLPHGYSPTASYLRKIELKEFSLKERESKLEKKEFRPFDVSGCLAVMRFHQHKRDAVRCLPFALLYAQHMPLIGNWSELWRVSYKIAIISTDWQTKRRACLDTFRSIQKLGINRVYVEWVNKMIGVLLQTLEGDLLDSEDVGCFVSFIKSTRGESGEEIHLLIQDYGSIVDTLFSWNQHSPESLEQHLGALSEASPFTRAKLFPLKGSHIPFLVLLGRLVFRGEQIEKILPDKLFGEVFNPYQNFYENKKKIGAPWWEWRALLSRTS